MDFFSGVPLKDFEFSPDTSRVGVIPYIGNKFFMFLGSRFGQLSDAGGKKEQEDKDYIDCAIRELYEESIKILDFIENKENFISRSFVLPINPTFPLILLDLGDDDFDCEITEEDFKIFQRNYKKAYKATFLNHNKYREVKGIIVVDFEDLVKIIYSDRDCTIEDDIKGFCASGIKCESETTRKILKHEEFPNIWIETNNVLKMHLLLKQPSKEV